MMARSWRGVVLGTVGGLLLTGAGAARLLPLESADAGPAALAAAGEASPAEGGTGACCLGFECVERLPEGDCLLRGGTYIGDGVGCGRLECGRGACCLDRECFDRFAGEECARAGGVFLGDGIDCSNSDCDAVGACCLPEVPTTRGPVRPEPPCRTTTELACRTLYRGVFLGVDSACVQVTTVVDQVSEDPREWVSGLVVRQECPTGRGPSADGCLSGPYKVDAWVSAGSLTKNCQDFAVNCPIPADFFAPRSDPFLGTVCFRSEPIGRLDLPGFGLVDFGDADILVRRDTDPFDPCDPTIGGRVSVPIEILAISLVSIDPITVTFGGGNPQLWDVRVHVDPSVPQPGGVMEATKTHCSGGTFDSRMGVCPQFIFTRRSDGAQRLLDYCRDCDPAGVVLSAVGVGWVHEPGPNVVLPSPVCTDFHAGVVELDPTTDCDCNDNGVADRGNPCDAGAECDLCGDMNGDGVRDFADLLIVLREWGTGGPRGDSNCNGVVNFEDILNILRNWD